MWLLCRSAAGIGFCAAAEAAEGYTPPSSGGSRAAANGRSTSESSSSSDVPSTSSSAASASDNNSSLHTLLSIPSLHSLNPPLHLAPLSAAAHDCLSALHPPQRRPAAPALAVCPASLLLYSASEAHITVHRLSDLQPIHTFAAPAGAGAGAVKSVSVSPTRLLTAHQDGKIRVWRRGAGPHRLLATLPTAADRLFRLPLPSSYVTVRRHKSRLWIQHADAVSAVAARGGLIYSVSWDKTLKIWRASDLRCEESVAAHEDAVNAVAVAGDGTVYTGSADRRIRVWARREEGKQRRRRRHELVATLERHRSAVNALALSGDGSTLYSGACDRSVLVWEREDSAGYMAVVGALRGHGKAILALAVAGDVLFSGSADRTVRIWRRSGGGGEGFACLGVMEGHVSGVRSLAAVRMPLQSESDVEEYRVCSGGLDGEVRVWRVRISNPKGSDWSCSLEKITV